MNQVGTIHLRDAEDTERLIDEVEDLIETKFLRYCDILNPLHFFTTGIVRSATNAVRLHVRMPPLMNQTISDSQRRDLCTLAQNIIDTNSAIYSNPSMKKFRWRIQAFFLWDALLCILLSLAKIGFYSPSGLNTTWSKVAEVYSNHEELVKDKRALYVSIGKVTLKAWLTNPPSNLSQEPAFITALREPKINSRRHESLDIGGDDSEITDAFTAFDELWGNMDGTDLNLNSNFSLGTGDGAFWDELC